MSAASYDFQIEQGTTVSVPVVWTDSTGAAINLAGYSARMQLRQSASSPNVLLELSSVLGTLVITPSTGTIVISMSATVTAGFTWNRAKYDLEVTSASGVVTRLIEGQITVSAEITR